MLAESPRQHRQPTARLRAMLVQVAERWREACPGWFSAAVARTGAELALVHEVCEELLPIQARKGAAMQISGPSACTCWSECRACKASRLEMRGSRWRHQLLVIRVEQLVLGSKFLFFFLNAVHTSTFAWLLQQSYMHKPALMAFRDVRVPHVLALPHIPALQQLMVSQAAQLRSDTLIQMWACAAASQRQGLGSVRHMLSNDKFKPRYDFIGSVNGQATIEVRKCVPCRLTGLFACHAPIGLKKSCMGLIAHPGPHHSQMAAQHLAYENSSNHGCVAHLRALYHGCCPF